MPVRNGSSTLAVAVESVRAQTHCDWELVIIDDHSTDSTPAILAEIAASDPRVTVIPNPVNGIATALDAGCAVSRGEWIVRMDADDLMLPERIERQLAFAHSNSGLGVISCMVRYGGDQPGYAAHVEWLNSLDSPELISLRRFVESPVAHPSVMFRRSLLETHGGYRNGDFPEDYELWLRWLAAGVPFGKCPETLLVWNDLPDRLSRTDPRYSIDAFYRTKGIYLSQWLVSNVCSGRQVWLWGAGRVTRRRFDSVETGGFRFDGFIDVDPKKTGSHRDGRTVVLADQIPENPRPFVVVGVGNRGAGARIHAELIARGWVEGLDFLMAA